MTLVTWGTSVIQLLHVPTTAMDVENVTWDYVSVNLASQVVIVVRQCYAQMIALVMVYAGMDVAHVMLVMKVLIVLTPNHAVS